jgi:hypothetical protein
MVTGPVSRLLSRNTAQPVGDALRTPFLRPALAHNESIIEEKGLLFVEQPFQNFGESTGCSGTGTFFEHLESLFNIFELIMNDKDA